MITFSPSTWVRSVDSLVLYQTSEDRVFATYHPKEKLLGLFWPSSPHSGLSKVTAIDEMLIAMAAVADMKHLPERLPEPRRVQYLDAADDVRKHCLEVVDAQPGAAGDAR